MPSLADPAAASTPARYGADLAPRLCSPHPSCHHPGTVRLLAGFYWEQCSGMQGLHCPRAGSPRPGTGRLWSTAAESCAFTTVCARACGRSPLVPAPACSSSSPARGQSCGVAPREVTGAGVSVLGGVRTLHTPTPALAGMRGRGALQSHLQHPRTVWACAPAPGGSRAWSSV